MLHDAIEEWAARAPDRAALVFGGATTTYASLADRVARTSSLVASLTEPGGRVAVIGENHPTWVECYYGVPRAGRVLLFLNHRLAGPELAAIVLRSGATVVVGAPAEVERVQTALRSVPSVRMLVDHDQWGAMVDAHDPIPSIARRRADTAWLLYTSGTTGAPKGAMLTHGGVLAAVEATSAARPIADDDVYLFPYPLCHVAGYNVVHHHVRGRPVVVVPRFDAASVAAAVRERAVTSMSLAATMLSSLLDHLDATRSTLPSLRTIAYGAAPMPVSLLRRAAAALPDVGFAQGYGMTELSGNAVFLDPGAHRRGLAGDERLLRGAGYAAPGVGVRTVDDHDADVGLGAPGEIVVRAPQVMSGYWDDVPASAAALRGRWLHTGDVGRLDADGLLTVIDRKKDVIITGGENVSSLEVEEVLRSHPAVGDVAVVGIPDEEWGENVCAVVVPAPGAQIDAVDLRAHARVALAGFKVPRHVVVVDTLPVNASGKVVKAELRAWLAANPDAVGHRA